MYAVIRTGGKQYRVAHEDVVRVERVSAEVGSQVDLDEVLMLGDGASTTVGTPLVDGARVVAQVIDQIRAPKITVFKKKRRKNHRRTTGHRQALTVLRITEILAAGAKPRKVRMEKQPEKAAKAGEEKKVSPPKEKTAAKSTEAKKTVAKKTAAPKKTSEMATKKVSTAKKATPKARAAKDGGDNKKAVAKKAAPKAKKKPAGEDKPAKPKATRAKKAKAKEEKK